jgi:hypothetical protein
LQIRGIDPGIVRMDAATCKLPRGIAVRP